jgi:CDP-diacylglycerol--glycerol-3-phosphate 3-phosphatidyltransferase
VDRLSVLAAPLVLGAITLTAFIVFVIRRAKGKLGKQTAVKHNQVFGPFFASFLVFMIGPIERRLLGRLSPNVITVTSLLLCIVAGVIVAFGELASAATLYLTAGILDVLDGRLARLSGKQTTSGALLDSVCDRWGELFALCGYAWLLRDTPWLLAAIGAIAGSMMVSYTRARAEGLGVQAHGGIMQRAERVCLVCLFSLIAAWFEVDGYAVAPIVGVGVALCGLASCATALNRFRIAYNALRAKEPAPAPVVPKPVKAPAPLLTPAQAREV